MTYKKAHYSNETNGKHEPIRNTKCLTWWNLKNEIIPTMFFDKNYKQILIEELVKLDKDIAENNELSIVDYTAFLDQL